MSHVTEDESGSGSSSEENEGEGGAPVESLVAGRERRATAGRWLGSLVAKAAADDADQAEVERTLDEIFDEGLPEEDVDFEEDVGDDDHDMAMSESDGDEDAGAGQDDDNLEGEKQLRKAERAEKLAKKRKARDALVAPWVPAKKVNTMPAAPTATSEAAQKPRPPKKSDRQSWLSRGDNGPRRASTRTQTVQNKATVQARMQESEKRRQKTVASMEAAARRKLRDEQPPKTQEERLAEAALVERRNNRSLNRWQLAEDQRQAEQKAKLEALRSKKLEGPVISWYSGPGHWVNGVLKGVGKEFKIEEIDENTETGAPQKDASSNKASQLIQTTDVQHQGTNGEASVQASSALAEVPQTQASSSQNQTESLQAPHPDLAGHTFAYTSKPPSHLPSDNLPHGIYDFATLPYQDSPPSPAPDHPIPAPDPAPLTAELALRSLVTLRSFPDLDSATKLADRHEALRAILLHLPPQPISTTKGRLAKSKTAKQSMPITCAVTDQPARYMDPHTGLPYASLYAYRMLRKTLEGRCRWSKLLGCWVGPEYELPFGKPAAGVPERFAERPRGVKVEGSVEGVRR
ncbi:MAG: hypothetical protein M1821_001690 [Bathelium mastoideum]|nr:MAG: hypothetical protein M1821_001690 [Bathelium mastoideum]KAI9691582.1 MAG: hypothetical protein M1822_007653 [Bathelium mastoideum]